MNQAKRENLIARLQSEIVIGDGAMGTQLYGRGVSLDANFEHLNLVRPELVRAVHNDYVRAGAQLIETNSFAANRVRLGTIGLGGKVSSINLAAARLAYSIPYNWPRNSKLKPWPYIDRLSSSMLEINPSSRAELRIKLRARLTFWAYLPWVQVLPLASKARPPRAVMATGY